MNRRGFLQSILLAAAAPAIVRADSLMRIVPRETGILRASPEAVKLYSEALAADTAAGEASAFVLSFFAKKPGGQWARYTQEVEVSGVDNAARRIEAIEAANRELQKWTQRAPLWNAQLEEGPLPYFYIDQQGHRMKRSREPIEIKNNAMLERLKRERT